MRQAKLVVHTDIILDHLTCASGEASVLRRTMEHYFCYTTVFNAIELFSLARTPTEKEAVNRSLGAMKILGLNAKGAPEYGMLLAGRSNPSYDKALVAGLCIESRLPLLSLRPQDFRWAKGLRLMSPRMVSGRFEIRRDKTATAFAVKHPRSQRV